MEIELLALINFKKRQFHKRNVTLYPKEFFIKNSAKHDVMGRTCVPFEWAQNLSSFSDTILLGLLQSAPMQVDFRVKRLCSALA